MAKRAAPTSFPRRQHEHDPLFRGAYAIAEVVRAHLNTLLPPHLLPLLDLQQLSPLPDTYVSDRLRPALADAVWQCPLRHAQHQWAKISFLFEHKSARPARFLEAQRIDYMLALWRKEQADGVPKPSLIVPIVLYHGPKPWTQTPFWEQFADFSPELQVYLPRFEYLLVDLSRLSDEDICSREPLGAARAVFLALKHAFHPERLVRHFRDIFIFACGLSTAAARERLVELLFTYVHKRTDMETKVVEQLPEHPREVVVSTYDRILAKGREEGLAKGRQEGRQEGLLEGLARGREEGVSLAREEFACNLLRHTDMDHERIGQLTGLPVERVAELRRQMVDEERTK